MPEPLDVSGNSRRLEDTITAAWLDEEGPYLALPLEPTDDEEPEATLRREAW